MTADEAADVLRRALYLGERVKPAELVEALEALAPEIGDPPRGFSTPAGCSWLRPAPGWVDLARNK